MILAALENDLETMPESVRAGALAASARLIARRLDDPETPGREVAALSRELRALLVVLHVEGGDELDAFLRGLPGS